MLPLLVALLVRSEAAETEESALEAGVLQQCLGALWGVTMDWHIDLAGVDFLQMFNCLLRAISLSNKSYRTRLCAAGALRNLCEIGVIRHCLDDGQCAASGLARLRQINDKVDDSRMTGFLSPTIQILEGAENRTRVGTRRVTAVK